MPLQWWVPLKKELFSSQYNLFSPYRQIDTWALQLYALIDAVLVRPTPLGDGMPQFQNVRHEHFGGVDFLNRFGHVEANGQVRDKDIDFAGRVELLVIVSISREEHHIILALSCIAIYFVGVDEILQGGIVIYCGNLYVDVPNGEFIAGCNLMSVI